MGCSKTLLFTSSCALESCVTSDRVNTGVEPVNEESLCYASDLCYAMVQTYNAGFTEVYINRYNPDTNTLTRKATLAPADFVFRWAYDRAHQLFVASMVGGKILIYDPQTELLTTFDSGIPGIWDFLYVPSKSKVYGRMGTDGGGLSYIGYVDLDLNIIVQLGTIPAVGGSKPNPRNYVYCPLTDCLYGCWSTGLGSSMSKFNLTTNVGTGSIIIGGIEGNEIAYDTDRNLIIVSFNTVSEVDPLTETIVRDTAIPPAAGAVQWTPVYVSSLKKVFGIGFGGVGDEAILSYNTLDFSSQIELNDYIYLGIGQLNAGGFLSSAYNDPTNEEGMRRVCLT